MNLNRRAFFIGLVATFAAPAIVRASSLMELRGTPLITPQRVQVMLGHVTVPEFAWLEVPSGIKVFPGDLVGFDRLKPEVVYPFTFENMKNLRFAGAVVCDETKERASHLVFNGPGTKGYVERRIDYVDPRLMKIANVT